MEPQKRKLESGNDGCFETKKSRVEDSKLKLLFSIECARHKIAVESEARAVENLKNQIFSDAFWLAIHNLNEIPVLELDSWDFEEPELFDDQNLENSKFSKSSESPDDVTPESTKAPESTIQAFPDVSSCLKHIWNTMYFSRYTTVDQNRQDPEFLLNIEKKINLEMSGKYQ